MDRAIVNRKKESLVRMCRDVVKGMLARERKPEYVQALREFDEHLKRGHRPDFS
jgi:hypothetical protein